jgi:hypothetical protein
MGGRSAITLYMRHFTGSLVAGGRGEKEQQSEAAEMVFGRQNGCRHLSADNVFSGTITNDARCNGFGSKDLAVEGRILYVSDVVLVLVRVEQQASPT